MAYLLFGTFKKVSNFDICSGKGPLHAIHLLPKRISEINGGRNLEWFNMIGVSKLLKNPLSPSFIK